MNAQGFALFDNLHILLAAQNVRVQEPGKGMRRKHPNRECIH